MAWFNRKVDEAVAKHGLQKDPTKPELPPNYENPRKLPQAWLDKYLNRKPEQLAIDVIRAHDANFKLATENKHLRRVIYLLSLIVSPLIGEVVKMLFHLLLK